MPRDRRDGEPTSPPVLSLLPLPHLLHVIPICGCVAWCGGQNMTFTSSCIWDTPMCIQQANKQCHIHTQPELQFKCKCSCRRGDASVDPRVHSQYSALRDTKLSYRRGTMTHIHLHAYVQTHKQIPIQKQLFTWMRRHIHTQQTDNGHTRTYPYRYKHVHMHRTMGVKSSSAVYLNLKIFVVYILVHMPFVNSH